MTHTFPKRFVSRYAVSVKIPNGNKGIDVTMVPVEEIHYCAGLTLVTYVLPWGVFHLTYEGNGLTCAAYEIVRMTIRDHANKGQGRADMHNICTKKSK